MREVDSHHIVTRVKGQAALMRRLRALLVAVARFDRCRAKAEDERRWCARTLDGLRALLREDGRG
jgi:hypothetical protein